jgi:hypothetical protein
MHWSVVYLMRFSRHIRLRGKKNGIDVFGKDDSRNRRDVF